MSDIQDLIHKTSMDCLERGKIVERERIIKLWQQEMACKCEDPMNHLAALIKGEN